MTLILENPTDDFLKAFKSLAKLAKVKYKKVQSPKSKAQTSMQFEFELFTIQIFKKLRRC